MTSRTDPSSLVNLINLLLSTFTVRLLLSRTSTKFPIITLKSSSNWPYNIRSSPYKRSDDLHSLPSSENLILIFFIFFTFSLFHFFSVISHLSLSSGIITPVFQSSGTTSIQKVYYTIPGLIYHLSIPLNSLLIISSINSSIPATLPYLTLFTFTSTSVLFSAALSDYL